LLRGWLDQATSLEVPVAQRFIQAALSAGAPDLAFACAQRVGLAALGEDAILDMARGLDVIGRKSDADALRASLGTQPGPVGAGAVPSGRAGPRDKLRLSQSFRLASLDQWRADLWKRVSDENKPLVVAAPASGQASAVAGARSQRPLHGFRALRQTKRFNSYRRHQNLNAGAPKKPNASPFSFFSLKPAG